jgi:hypothetical protein
MGRMIAPLGDWIADFLGAFGQEQECADEEAHRADQGAEVRPLGVAQLAGRRADVAGHRGHAEGDGPDQVDQGDPP